MKVLQKIVLLSMFIIFFPLYLFLYLLFVDEPSWEDFLDFCGILDL